MQTKLSDKTPAAEQVSHIKSELYHNFLGTTVILVSFSIYCLSHKITGLNIRTSSSALTKLLFKGPPQFPCVFFFSTRRIDAISSSSVLLI